MNPTAIRRGAPPPATYPEDTALSFWLARLSTLARVW